MSKNQGPFQAFGKQWFEKHQRSLLWFCNAPIIKDLFRWILCISEAQCSKKTRITLITPNCFAWGDRLIIKNGRFELERTGHFEVHPKYAKRIYLAFAPVWWAMHYWDILIANKLQPAWNLGFDDLGPVRPLPGTTADGLVVRLANEIWSSIRTNAGTGADYTTTRQYFAINASSTTDQWLALNRYACEIDTSDMGGGTVSSASFFLRVSTLNNTYATLRFSFNIFSSNPANNATLVAADYGTFGATPFSDNPIAGLSLSTSAFNEWALNSVGCAGLSTDGISKIGIRESDYDATGTTPAWENGQTFSFRFYTGSYSGTTLDPYLTAVFSIPAASSGGAFLYLMV